MESRLQHGGVAAAVLALLLSISSAPSSFTVALVHPTLRTRHRRHPAAARRIAPFPDRASISNNGQTVLRASGVEAPPKPQESPAAVHKKHKHTMAILTLPHSASARIANEAILETAISVTTDRLSVVLRTNTGGSDSRTGEDYSNVSLTQLRRYAGEVYSMAWDAAIGLDERENNTSETHRIATGGKLLDLIVYPQNLPNAPPEGWIELRPDLTCICSHDSITGWVTSDSSAGGSGRQYASMEGQGVGGLQEHVNAVNAERGLKGLEPLEALHVDDWPDGAEVTGDPNVVFLEDEDAFEKMQMGAPPKKGEEEDGLNGLVGPGGTPIPPSSLYSSVCVGGTFDGMHYGHRKLLTLAISSVQPIEGTLLIGVTRDEMLTSKSFAEAIPPLEDRIAGVLDFIGNLAPGMKNRIRCVPISDEYGPPGQPPDSQVYPGLVNDFDALVLSHETLPTGRKLNHYREEVLGLKPLKLLCTQRTEPHGMSSTALRRMRSKK